MSLPAHLDELAYVFARAREQGQSLPRWLNAFRRRNRQQHRQVRLDTEGYPAVNCAIMLRHRDTGRLVGPCAEGATYVENDRWMCRRGHPL